jgi:hypothetical protein
MKRLLGILALAIASPALAEDLTDDAQAKLDANGMVIVDRPLHQGFSAYIGARHPVFITSDSLLMAYHRIFEEMVGELEVGELIRFRDFWSGLWKNLPVDAGKGADEAAKQGHRRARLLVATAHRLLTGAAPEGLSENEASAVSEEVRRVETGQGTTPPLWILANPALADSVSYTAFLPTGTHADNETTKRYYRFRKWLQEMQINPSDESTLSMLTCIGISMGELWPEHHDSIQTPLLLGDFESGILNQLAEHCDSWMAGDSIAERREEFSGSIPHRSRWRLFATLIPGGSKITRKILDISPKRVSETPLAVGTSLGNSVAASLLEADLSQAADCGDFIFDRDWHLLGIRHYFDALRTLSAEPDERVPPIFRSGPWKRKQLNATLGSWTEYRYALGLAAREDVHFFGMTQQEPGFVEPLPTFYRHLGESAENFLMLRSRRSSPRDLQGRWVTRLQEGARLLREIQAATRNGGTVPKDLEDKVVIDLSLFDRLVPRPPGRFYGGSSMPSAPDAERCGEIADHLESLSRSWWEGDPAAIESVARAIAGEPDLIGPRLSRLAGVCFRLEAMAERQLSGRPWNDIDRKFLNDYGATLGWLMFYEGNSYLTPRDDAPRIVRYATLAGNDGQELFHAATARPRLFYIRYPNREGKEILCQGSVYAYRDDRRPATPPPKEWQAMSEKSPWPTWIAPIVGSYEPPKEQPSPPPSPESR